MTMAQTDLFLDTQVIEITPQQAALWLEAANIHNRPLKMGRCQILADAIRRGEWVLNGDAIRFCTSGQLLDGQHRLQAIVIAGKPVKSLVVRGLQPGTFTTIDTNRSPRSATDVLALSGVNHYATVAPAARLLHAYRLYGNPYENSTEKAPTADQVLAAAQTPGLVEIAAKVKYGRFSRRYLGAGLATFAWHVFREYRPEHADAFFSKLESGVGLEEGSPILLLRERLTTQAGPHERLRPLAKGAYLFKAFRLYLLGADVKQLKLVFNKNIPLRDHFLLERRGEGPHDQR